MNIIRRESGVCDDGVCGSLSSRKYVIVPKTEGGVDGSGRVSRVFWCSWNVDTGWNMDLLLSSRCSSVRCSAFWRFLIGVSPPIVFAGWEFSCAGSSGCCDQLLSLIGTFFFAVMDRASLRSTAATSVPFGTRTPLYLLQDTYHSHRTHVYIYIHTNVTILSIIMALENKQTLLSVSLLDSTIIYLVLLVCVYETTCYPLYAPFVCTSHLQQCHRTTSTVPVVELAATETVLWGSFSGNQATRRPLQKTPIGTKHKETQHGCNSLY